MPLRNVLQEAEIGFSYLHTVGGFFLMAFRGKSERTSSIGMRSAILLSSYFVDVRFETGSNVTGDGAATIFFV